MSYIFFLSCLQEALDTLQFTKEDQEHAFGLLAAVLWIGNITFQIIDSENHVEVIANEGNTRTKIRTTWFTMFESTHACLNYSHVTIVSLYKMVRYLIS